MTGPIQVPPIPDVRPVFYGTANAGQDRLQRSFEMLMLALEDQQKNAQLQATLAQTNATQGQAGTDLASFLAAIGAQPDPRIQPTIPSTAGSAGITMQPFVPSSPALMSFRGKPGQAVLEAVKAGSGAISAEAARVAKLQEEAAKPTQKAYQLSWQGGKAFKFNPATGQLHDLGVSVDDVTKDVWMLDANYELPDGTPIERNSKTGMIRPAPYPNLVRGGPINAGEEQAASNYHAMSSTWTALKEIGFPILSKDLVKQVLQIRGAMGSSAIEKWIAENTQLSDTDKAALSAWSNIVRDIVYQQSGKQVTVQEFQAAIRNNIPTESDGPKTMAVKLGTLRGKVNGGYKLGYRAIRRNERMGLGQEIDPVTLFDIHRTATTPQGVGPVRLTPYDSTADQPGAGTVLRPPP